MAPMPQIIVSGSNTQGQPQKELPFLWFRSLLPQSHVRCVRVGTLLGVPAGSVGSSLVHFSLWRWEGAHTC